MLKMYCDRCGKELDQANMKYVGLSINDYGDDTSDLEHWDFCQECARSIKHSMIRNIADYEQSIIKADADPLG